MKTVNISFTNFAAIKMMNDSLKNFSFTPDTLKKTVQIFSYRDTVHKSMLAYYYPDSSHLVFHGKLKNDSVYIVMQKLDLNKIPLINRGFHWINEYPYNR
jgi:hypothetical protein